MDYVVAANALSSTSAAKRCVDIIGAIMVLLVSLPALILIAIAIKLDSRGPILFCQDRFGERQRVIRVYKFRTMRVAGADPTGARQTMVGDPRVTRIGRFLRAHSIDEVPQFLNVLIGNMSLVGPRPLPIGMKVEGRSLATINNWNMRYAVKPGLTGLAQVNGSRGALVSIGQACERLDYDTDYLTNWSLRLDLIIILRTILLCVYDGKAH